MLFWGYPKFGPLPDILEPVVLPSSKFTVCSDSITTINIVFSPTINEHNNKYCQPSSHTNQHSIRESHFMPSPLYHQHPKHYVLYFLV